MTAGATVPHSQRKFNLIIVLYCYYKLLSQMALIILGIRMYDSVWACHKHAFRYDFECIWVLISAYRYSPPPTSPDTVLIFEIFL